MASLLAGLAIATAAADLAISGVVLAVYGRAYAQHQRAARTDPGRSRWRGLLPWHVWVISTSHMLLIGYTAVDLIGDMTDPQLAPVLVLLTAYTLSAAAQWVILGLARQRRIDISRAGLAGETQADLGRDAPPAA